MLVNTHITNNVSFYLGVVNNLFSIDVKETIVLEYINTIKKESLLKQISLVSYEITEGKKTQRDLDNLIGELSKPLVEEKEDRFVSSNLNSLISHCIKTPGLRWRLNSLNLSLGSLRKGDFGFIFARPESFSRDTEVLTPSGWLTVDKVTKETYIGQVDSNRKLSFIKPLAVHPHEQTHCYHIHDTLGRVDLIVTEGHSMVIEKDGVLVKERADTVKYKQGIKHHVSASTFVSDDKNEVSFLPEHRLQIAYQADGHTRNYKEYGYTFSFKKKRKQERLKEILSLCGYQYTEYKDGNRGHLGYYVKSSIKLNKNFDWINLALVSKEWCQKFIEELSYWDATRRTEYRFKFDTTDKEVADKVQAIAILAGYNCLLTRFSDDRRASFHDIFSLSIRTNYQPVDGQCIKKERIPFSDTTYCFEVPTGMLLVRRNGAVAVSGNTGKTTFLASEGSFFAQQAKEQGLNPGIWVN